MWTGFSIHKFSETCPLSSGITIKTRDLKGPHIAHLSTLCHLYWQIGQGSYLDFPISSKNTDMVEEIEILLLVKFHWILFNGFQRRSRKCFSQSEALRPSCLHLNFWSHDLDRQLCPNFWKKINLGIYFLTEKDLAFILSMNIPGHKTFLSVPKFWSITLTSNFDLLFEKKT